MSWEWQSLDNDVMNIWQDGTGIHLQLFRWDDECYFNIDTPWVVPSLADLFEVQDGLLRAEWLAGKIEFERKSAEEVEEGFIQDERGGVEIYIVSNAKPISNVMEFPISHQGLNFYYQEGSENTPEKVIGSYAVYHSTKGRFFTDPVEAEKYKAGKAFHLYRPKITDSKPGNPREAWIDLNIDTETNLMTLTIPQNFLDNATYPITIDPNFGYETQGTADYGDIEGFMVGPGNGTYWYNTSGAGKGVSISVCLYINNQNLKSALYGNDISPASYIQTTDERTDITEKVKDFYAFNFSTQPDIANNTKYCLVCWGGTTGGGSYARLYYDRGDNENHHIAVSGEYGGDWPATLAYSTSSTRMYSLYCTFTLSEGAAYIPKVIGPF